MKRSSAFLPARRDKSRVAVSFRGNNATIPLKFAAVAAANDNDVGGITGDIVVVVIVVDDGAD